TAWILKPQVMKNLLKNPSTQITENDVVLDVKQKGVDMRIGLDISSITLKKQADKIILFSGDSDFVPAAKLARREGIDFILDPMWN
ncbi:NYN domain-containing protein, partial [Neisseria meningitidis]